MAFFEFYFYENNKKSCKLIKKYRLHELSLLFHKILKTALCSDQVKVIEKIILYSYLKNELLIESNFLSINQDLIKKIHYQIIR
tara:strand:- start:341 stop:592 length:252 start_codon:yes stop_codon:yes gene_type:complete